MATTISDDEFMTTLTSLIDRPLWALSEDHFYFSGPDPQIMMHVWREDGFYFGGASERSYRPAGRIRANDLTTVKQWLVMELFDFLRLSWQLEDIGIAFRWLSPAPHWSQDPKTGELLHEGSSTGIVANASSRSPTLKAPRKPARPSSACHASPSLSPRTDRSKTCCGKSSRT